MSRSMRSYFESASESTDVASSKNLNVVNNEHNINADTANGKPLEDHINNAEIETSVEETGNSGRSTYFSFNNLKEWFGGFKKKLKLK